MVAHTLARHLVTSKLWLPIALLVLATAAMNSQVRAQNDTSGQQAVIEIVRLQHRDPAQIRAAITPYLDERGAINQIDNNLIISTSRANLARLEELITELDIPRRQLRISVDFRYGRPPAPSLADDAAITTIPMPSLPENTVQTIVVTEGEFAYFNLVGGNPVGGLRFTEIAALLEQQRLGDTQTLSLTAHPRDSGAVIEIAALQAEPDLNGNMQPRVVSRTIDVSLNQWHVVTPGPNPSAAFAAATQTEPTAVRVEVLP